MVDILGNLVCSLDRRLQNRLAFFGPPTSPKLYGPSRHETATEKAETVYITYISILVVRNPTLIDLYGELTSLLLLSHTLSP